MVDNRILGRKYKQVLAVVIHVGFWFKKWHFRSGTVRHFSLLLIVARFFNSNLIQLNWILNVEKSSGLHHILCMIKLEKMFSKLRAVQGCVYVFVIETGKLKAEKEHQCVPVHEKSRLFCCAWVCVDRRFQTKEQEWDWNKIVCKEWTTIWLNLS